MKTIKETIIEKINIYNNIGSEIQNLMISMFPNEAENIVERVGIEIDDTEFSIRQDIEDDEYYIFDSNKPNYSYTFHTDNIHYHDGLYFALDINYVHGYNPFGVIVTVFPNVKDVIINQ